MLFRRGDLIITFVLCLALFYDLPMSVALMSIIGKHKRIAIAQKPAAAACRILSFPSYRPAGMCFSDSQLIDEAAVILLNGGQRGVLRGKAKGGWYSVAVHDANMGAETIRKMRSSEFKLAESLAKGKAKHNVLSKEVLPSAEFFRSLGENGASGTASSKTKSKLEYCVPVIDAPQLHKDCKNWVIFSDLHVKSASMDVCEEVLHQVHQAAVDRDAGVIFLGDFWHVRGSLSVELLNRVLKALGKWKQPVIMIPGNHDQVTLGGKVHSLEPLVYAFHPDQILMINEPAVCMGALWVPYRRDPAVLKAVLRAGAAMPDVSMVFCHADVKGAYMNDNMRSKEGIDITDFPKNLPIFSGHFHKPHTISKQKSTLRYVGSPYQTSLSEAGQDKFFYLVGREPAPASAVPSTELGYSVEPKQDAWKEIERWTVSIGSKIIKASSPADPSALTAKAGDRVVVTVPVGQDYAAQTLLADLEALGIEVDLQYEHNPLTRRRVAASAMAKVAAADQLAENFRAENEGHVHDAGSVAAEVEEDGRSAVGAVKVEDMDPLRIFDTYMSQLESNSTAADTGATTTPAESPALSVPQSLTGTLTPAKVHASVLEEGRRTIDRLMSSAGVDGSAVGDRVSITGAGNGARVKDLRLESVTLSNFGPYGGDKAVEYPLSSRGLVLIRGQSSDGTGADSNGAGKTTLAMSVMWGLTGSLDARMVGDSKSADVTYDAVLSRLGTSGAADIATGKKKSTAAAKESKLMAEVVVQGWINSIPFEIIRRRSAKKAELHFRVDGKELTTQAVKDTQALIDEHLGIQSGLLQRCCFFGQHTHTMQSLLGLTDVKLKQELSALVDTSLWVTACQDVRSRERSIRSKLQELSVEARLRKEEFARVENGVNAANATLNGFQSDLEAAQRRASEIPLTNVSISDLNVNLTVTQNEMEAFVSSVLDPLKLSTRELAVRKETALAEVDKAVNELRVRVTKHQTERTAAANTAAVQQKKLDQIVVQETNSGKLVDQLSRNITTLSTEVVSFDPHELRQAHEKVLSELASVNLRIDAAKTSLERLQELGTAITAHTASSATHAAHSADEECPTCGQEMPQESRAKREAELQSALHLLQQEKERATSSSALRRKIYDCAVALVAAREQLVGFQSRSAELGAEVAGMKASLKSLTEKLLVLETELAERVDHKNTIAAEFVNAESTHAEKLRDAEFHMVSLTAQERAIRSQIDELRLKQEQQSTLKRSADAQVALAQDRVASAFKTLQERTTALEASRAVISANEAVSEDLTMQCIVLERLVSVLGARGIQNFVFQNVIAQLESITNAYLMVLAEGGIQLALQGDGADEDRIVKTVWVRSKESQGEYRERNLAQLSGGQWRRVSLALDFAFAELIRRRGVLRCNLMVMDEVLTHLDASGRESVGTVLRAMVQGPSINGTAPATTAADADADGVDEYGVALPNGEELKMQQMAGALLGGGAYETVIVILQDLAAAELAEAFDHVDVVVKEADSSVVILDGADA